MVMKGFYNHSNKDLVLEYNVLSGAANVDVEEGKGMYCRYTYVGEEVAQHALDHIGDLTIKTRESIQLYTLL